MLVSQNVDTPKVLYPGRRIHKVRSAAASVGCVGVETTLSERANVR
jgi:hypothetical protein